MFCNWLVDKPSLERVPAPRFGPAKVRGRAQRAFRSSRLRRPVRIDLSKFLTVKDAASTCLLRRFAHLMMAEEACNRPVIVLMFDGLKMTAQRSGLADGE
jgi:hypothetical protein